MLRGRPAASAHDGDVIFLDKLDQRIGKRLGFERIDRLAIHIKRQTGVGDAGNRQYRLLTEDADGLAHVLGASGTIQADDIDRQPFQDGQGGDHVRAQ